MKKAFSYSAGERGRNRVRVGTDRRTGILYMAWMEERAEKRRSLGHRDREAAKQKADELAARFAEIPTASSRSLTLARLFQLYHERRTPKKKSEMHLLHDHRAGKLFMAAFGSGFDPHNLDRACWDHYIEERRTGRLVADGKQYGPVRDRAVQEDLKFVVSVLNWACGFLENGRPLLDRNPWGSEIRRAQSWGMPREKTPRRPAMTDELRRLLCSHAPSWQMRAAMLLGRETVSRNSSVRQLRWDDVDLRDKTVRWRGEFDKVGREVITPLSDEAIEVLKQVPRQLDSPWIFASDTDPSQPTPRDTFQIWLRRAKDRLLRSIEDEQERERMRQRLHGLGYHGEKRAGVRDDWFRSLDPKRQELFSRTNHKTLVDVYDDVSLDEMRQALRERRRSEPRWEELRLGA
jgi:integrase